MEVEVEVPKKERLEMPQTSVEIATALGIDNPRDLLMDTLYVLTHYKERKEASFKERCRELSQKFCTEHIMWLLYHFSKSISVVELMEANLIKNQLTPIEVDVALKEATQIMLRVIITEYNKKQMKPEEVSKINVEIIEKVK